MFNDTNTRRSLSIVGLGLVGGMLVWWLWRRRSEQPARWMPEPGRDWSQGRIGRPTPEVTSLVEGLALPELEWLSPSAIPAYEPAALEATAGARTEMAGLAMMEPVPDMEEDILAAVETDPDAVPAAAPAAGTGVESGAADDLAEEIEGIGPAIARVLRDAGITTFDQLAGTEVDRLREILRAAGLRLADPTTWPEQARLASAGRREELAALKGRLRGGRQV